jgi:hypothetical protein
MVRRPPGDLQAVGGCAEASKPGQFDLSLDGITRQGAEIVVRSYALTRQCGIDNGIPGGLSPDLIVWTLWEHSGFRNAEIQAQLLLQGVCRAIVASIPDQISVRRRIRQSTRIRPE